MNKRTSKKQWDVRSQCWEHLCHILLIWSLTYLGFPFTAKTLIIPFFLSLYLVLNIKRNAGVDNADYCTVSVCRWNNAMEEDKKNRQGGIFLCWIVLFDPECGERRALCNIFSAHMADCVTAKHMGGGVLVVAIVGYCVRWGGCRQTRGKKQSHGWQYMDVKGISGLFTLVFFPY